MAHGPWCIVCPWSMAHGALSIHGPWVTPGLLHSCPRVGYSTSSKNRLFGPGDWNPWSPASPWNPWTANQPSIQSASQPASLGPSRKLCGARYRCRGRFGQKKRLASRLLKGRFFGGEVLGLVLIHGSHGMKPWKVFIHKIDS